MGASVVVPIMKRIAYFRVVAVATLKTEPTLAPRRAGLIAITPLDRPPQIVAGVRVELKINRVVSTMCVVRVPA